MPPEIFVLVGFAELMGLVQELNSLHLIEVTVPLARTENHGNYAVELTLLGRKFVERYAK